MTELRDRDARPHSAPGVSPETPDEFSADFRCVATPGTGGCGWEQQLEAALKAVTPSTSSVRFVGGTPGHGDRENAGFLRDDSTLAIVFVTDEDDCSVQAGFEDVFNRMSTRYTDDLNVRCFDYPEVHWPVQRYVDGFKALRPGREDLVVFGVITGVPVDLITTGTPNYAVILSDPRMIETINTSAPSPSLVPSCNVPGRGTALPGRRMVQAAQGFGANGVVQSICQESFSGALDAIITKIAGTLGT